MIIGRVSGHIVSTQKEPAMSGAKLVVVEVYSGNGPDGAELAATGRFFAAADSLGVHVGDFVLVTQGSSARLTTWTREMPVDAVVIGIVDAVRLKERVFERAAGTLK